MAAMRPPSAPRGVVLAAVVVLLLALTLVTHGAVVVARGFRHGGDEVWEAVRVRRAVAGRVDAARRGVDVASGWRPAGEGVEVRVRPLRLSPELTLWWGEGRSAVARWSAASLAWQPDPVVRGQAMRAVASVGRRVRLSEGLAAVVAPPGGSCPADLGPTRLSGLAPGGVGLGPLSIGDLAARVPPWSPATPSSHCGADGCPPVAGSSAGSLTIAGGHHRGLHVVLGDLVVTDGATLVGTVLVGGTLTLRAGARVFGSVEVVGDLNIEAGASLVGDPCTIAALWADGLRERLGPVFLEASPWAAWEALP